MENKKKLSACPFCKEKRDIYLLRNDLGFSWVKCRYCGAESDKCKTDDTAIASWNKKANEG